MTKTHIAKGVAVLAACTLFAGAAQAQRAARNAAPAGPPPTPQQAAPFDLSGYWESVVTEDWRWRMLTPPKGDYTSMPLNAQGIKVANTWTEDQDGSCKAYGMAGLMRMPTDLHVTWADANTIKVQTDWGMQTRMLRFEKGDGPVGAPSAQGNSFAQWERPVQLAIGAYRPNLGAIDVNGNVVPAAPRGNNGGQPQGGYLKIETSNLAPGWLRRNGVPYSAKTRVTEYIQGFKDPQGREWIDVFTVVEDPEYLAQPYVTSSDYRRLPDGSKWSPHPCKE
jgi:hypothetical protein